MLHALSYTHSNQADEILPGLWLGNAAASMNAQFLAEKRISVVFNCTKDHPFYPSILHRYRVPVDDNLQQEEIRNLELWSYEIVYKLTREYKSGRPILVHCAAGMQRSAACIAMFLISTKNMTPQQAIEYIQARRPIAFRPAANFKQAIEGFYTSYQNDVAPQVAAFGFALSSLH
jgi:dual specificity phosphatase 12